MEHTRQETTKTTRRRLRTIPKEERKNSPEGDRRKELYAEDETYRHKIKKYTRSIYQRNKRDRGDEGFVHASGGGKGYEKEVVVGEEDGTQVTTVYTLPESAKFLGKNLITLNSWIDRGYIPPPILTDTTKNYRHYSHGELKIIKTILDRHMTMYDYFTDSDSTTIHTIWQYIEAYRKENI